MSYRIDQLNLQSNGTWLPDNTHFTTGALEEVTGSTNRFAGKNLTLFSGMNRITFTGTQGSTLRSDVFYVLYDQIPYIQSLKVMSGSTIVNLNEGAQAVVPAKTITLQGVAINANNATVSVNGGVAIKTSVLPDGTFFSPAVTLIPGLNELKMSITNGTNTINIKRELYYFDINNPFTDVKVKQGATNEFSILNNIPSITDVGVTAVGYKVKMLLPYTSTPFAGSGTYTARNSVTSAVYDGISGTVATATEIIIPGSDGITPQYRLVDFTLPNLNLHQTSGVYDKDQFVNMVITYGNFSSTFNGNFKYLPGETIIKNIQLLPGYNGSANVTTVAKEPLNGAEVNDSTFYILVDADKPLTADSLSGTYLPLSTLSLTLDDLGAVAGLGGNQAVYRVDNFTNGQQKVQFKIGSSTATYNADITYVQKSYIYIANLYDGQRYEFDSRNSNSITISGKYMGFKNLSGAQYFVNGKEMTAPANPALTDAIALSGFSLALNVDTTGPLVFGENRIVFKGVNTSVSGITQEIIKEIRIYLVDTNVSKIDRFQPTLSVATRQSFPSTTPGTYTDDVRGRIFAVSPEFVFTKDKYVTSELGYDLVMQGSGASTLNVKLGSDLFFSKPIPARGTPVLEQAQTFTYKSVTYYYDFAGDETNFIFRIRDIKFEAPGSHVYNLELINRTGAITKQTLDITRELSSFRLLSPQPTVGDQIIVNKNFVRFDIEAEGATEVLVDGEQATKRADLNNRFVYDFVGLKAGKMTEIDIDIIRVDSKLSQSVNVFYSDTVQVDTQFMQKMGTKFDMFNKTLQLTFPKGTVLKAANENTLGITKLYNDTNVLFGIANPEDGIVERRNDYGNIINRTVDARTYQGASPIVIPDFFLIRFANNTNTFNFNNVSPTYWISAGVGELGNRGDIGYKPATNGLAPYSVEGRFTEYELERKVIPSNRGQLTLKYDSSVVDEAGYIITVFRYTDRGEWENIGGEVNTSSHTVTVPFDDFGYYKVMKMRKGFADVTNHTWARNILNALYSKGIMNNVRFDEFGANDLTTRGEFATLLVKGLNLPLNYEGNASFFDITPGTKTTTWDYEHIETAARAGIISGLEEGFFGAGIPVTRQDAAVMIARGLKLKMAINNDKLETSIAKSFADSGTIQFYARPAVDAVNKAKIMTGAAVTIPGVKKPVYNFNARSNMTRAEAGKITVELLKKSTKIFPKNLS
ncbi:S-layer homology domain-containing protein [Cohnella sp. GCM10027633]|uniref:S-layer homology domain-containing protein n=1 Tax=unclassified Cohnella TaxID=2636738 RepID=UPI0036280B6D